MCIIYRISHSSPFPYWRMTCCGDLNGKQGSCMTPSMTTIPEKKCVTWKLNFTLVFYFNYVFQDLLVGREASGAFRVVLGVCSLGWRGCYQGCRGCNRGWSHLGMQPGMQGIQLGMQPGMQGMQQGMLRDATRDALCILCIQARMCSFKYKDALI